MVARDREREGGGDPPLPFPKFPSCLHMPPLVPWYCQVSNSFLYGLVIGRDPAAATCVTSFMVETGTIG